MLVHTSHTTTTQIQFTHRWVLQKEGQPLEPSPQSPQQQGSSSWQQADGGQEEQGEAGHSSRSQGVLLVWCGTFCWLALCVIHLCCWGICVASMLACSSTHECTLLKCTNTHDSITHTFTSTGMPTAAESSADELLSSLTPMGSGSNPSLVSGGQQQPQQQQQQVRVVLFGFLHDKGHQRSFCPTQTPLTINHR